MVNNTIPHLDQRHEVVANHGPVLTLSTGEIGIIRPAEPGDGNTLRKLIHASNKYAPAQDSDGVIAVVDERPYPDITGGSLRRRKTDKFHPINALTTMRIASVRGKAVGFSYSAPPLIWLPQQKHLPTRHIAAMTDRFTELELLAVDPRFQRRGIASALVDDVMTRYRDAGYRAMMVMINREPDGDELTAWYTRRGFTFAEWGVPYLIQPWSARPLTLMYDNLKGHQRIGIIPLADPVRCEPSKPAGIIGGPVPIPPTCVGILD